MEQHCCTLALLGRLPPGPAPELEALGSEFGEVLICNDRPTEHLALGLSIVAPLAASSLGALLPAIMVARHDWVVALDLGQPLPSTDNLIQLAVHPSAADAVLLQAAHLLPGRYARSCAPALERALRSGCTGVEALRGLRRGLLEE